MSSREAFRIILPTGKAHAAATDLHRVLEAVVELHLDAPVFADGVQDHSKQQLPQALENSAWAGTHSAFLISAFRAT